MKKPPTIKELKALFIHLKKHIDDDFTDEEGNKGMDVTIGSDGTDWTYQTGSNEYMGGAYHYPHWAVVSLTPRSNSRDLAIDVRDQLEECFSQCGDDENE